MAIKIQPKTVNFQPAKFYKFVYGIFTQFIELWRCFRTGGIYQNIQKLSCKIVLGPGIHQHSTGHLEALLLLYKSYWNSCSTWTTKCEDRLVSQLFTNPNKSIGLIPERPITKHIPTILTSNSVWFYRQQDKSIQFLMPELCHES
jgi:hypothetical protein